jgi:hypothetical protein
MGQIKDGVAQKHHEFFMLSVESTRQGLVSRFHDNTVSYPLPELGLRGPEFSPVTADHERGLSLLLFFLVFLFLDGHILPNTRVALHGISYRHRAKTPGVKEATHSTPKGSLMCKAASGFQE